MTNSTAAWKRNKEGNTALGTLTSKVSERILATNISLSHAKLAFPEYTIYEDK